MPTLDSVISVTTEIAGAVPAAPNRPGGALIVTTDGNVLSGGGTNKIASYETLAEVGTAGFGTDSEVYKAAAAYFGQNPSPPQISVGRWANSHDPSEIFSGTPDPIATIAASSTRLVSGDQPAAATTLTVPSTPAIVGIGGNTNSVSPSTGAASTAVATIASDLQTAFRAESFDGAADITVTIEGTGANSRFVITVPAGVSIRAGGLTGNLATLLGFLGSDNPRYEAPFTMSVDGTSATVNVLLSAATGGTLLTAQSAVATAVQTALGTATPTGFSTLTVTYNATQTRFELGDGTTSGNVRTLTAPTGALANAMGLSLDDGATVREGDDGDETAAEFFADVGTVSNDWYWVILERPIFDNLNWAEDFSRAVQSTRKQLILDYVNSTIPAASAPIGLLAARGRSRTSIIWSATADYKAAALAGQFAGRDLSRSNTAVTAKFRTLTGRDIDSLTPAQITVLNNQHINYYTEFGGTAILAEGVSTADGQFIETQHWVDWFAQEAQTRIFSLLQSTSRVPQTAAGIALLIDRVEDVCHLGIGNGGIAPGILSQSVTNAVRTATSNPSFDGELGNGYLIYVSPLSSLSESQRAAGNVPPVRVWLKGSGAVHFVELDLTLGG